MAKRIKKSVEKILEDINKKKATANKVEADNKPIQKKSLQEIFSLPPLELIEELNKITELNDSSVLNELNNICDEYEKYKKEEINMTHNNDVKMTNKITAKRHAVQSKQQANREAFANEFLTFTNANYQDYISRSLPTPRAMKNMLDRYIVGQDKAKKDISIAIFNQQRLGRQLMVDGDSIVEKSNVFLLGPTGSGKTAMLQRLAKSLNVPFVIEDITAFSSTGYVGRDVEQILRDLINRTPDKNGYSVISGIIYLDEIDKLARKQVGSNTTADPSHMELQNGLLKMIEGTDVEICMSTARHVSGSPSVMLNTRNILFIAGGAFNGLDKIVEARLKKENKESQNIGFGAQAKKMKEYTKDELYAMATVEDLVEYGMSREFVGRFPIITRTEALTVDTLKQILVKPQNSLVNQYKEMFNMVSGTELEITDEALTVISNRAIERGTGARALKGVMDPILRDVMFDLPSESFSLVKVIGNVEHNTIDIEVYKYNTKTGKNVKLRWYPNTNADNVA